jgi:hypothetical protein
MIQLAYFSSVRPHWSQGGTERILITSRENNRRRGLTGMLIYYKHNYLQILEGLHDPVLALYDVIESDRRHTGVIEILRQSITQRDFPNYSMSFCNLSTVENDLDGYCEFLREHFDLGSLRPSGTIKLFRLLKDAATNS